MKIESLGNVDDNGTIRIHNRNIFDTQGDWAFSDEFFNINIPLPNEQVAIDFSNINF